MYVLNLYIPTYYYNICAILILILGMLSNGYNDVARQYLMGVHGVQNPPKKSNNMD